MNSIRQRFFFLLLGLGLLCARTSSAYVLNGYRWPDGTQVTMHLQLSRPFVPLQDGSASWNDSAADALAIWNQNIAKVKFVAADAGPATGGDGVNAVFFANNVYGDSFGSNVLAITLTYYQGATANEADVIFNNARNWNSYRGPVQGSGPNGVYDLHRVALHEFGHVLGLDHPDTSGQAVDAIMNSIISDLDQLADDDIDGALFLYGLHITSSEAARYINSGDQFTYQVTAANNPTSFQASGLPSGLQINPTTGLISGQCSTSGTFTIRVIARGATGPASGTFPLHVQPLPVTSPSTVPPILFGDSFSYQITAANSPTSFTVTGLPVGLTYNPITGVISGVSRYTGYYIITIIAHGPTSEASGTLTITIGGPQITSNSHPPSANIGSNFDYLITANNRPTSFAVENLPAGLDLDPATGRINGVLTLSGLNVITVKAYGEQGVATASLDLYVNSLPSTLPTTVLARLPLPLAGGIVADPARPRIYLAQPNSIAVLDSSSFAVLQTIALSVSPGELSISADGSKLWISNNYPSTISSIDLNTLVALPDLPTGLTTRAVREGADGRLYISNYDGVYQLDKTSGATLAHFAVNAAGSSAYTVIDVSPDRKTLFAEDSSALAKYDISQGGNPVLLQRVPLPTSFLSPLAVTPDSTRLVAGPRVFSANDLSAPSTVLTSDIREQLTALSKDGLYAYQASAGSYAISVYRIPSGAFVRYLYLPDFASIRFNALHPMAIDASGNNLFVTVTSPEGDPSLCVLATVPPPELVLPQRLLNVATRLKTQTGDNVLIGGFIIGGTESKKVILRATGPSLPVPGSLADPLLELHGPDGALLAQNDNWNSHRTDVVASGLPPANEHESAIVVSLAPGAYTAVLRGVGNTSGVALVELFDLSPSSSSRIGNISTRGKVETGDNVMIGGFIIGGDQPTKVIVRAIGPSLGSRGVAGALADTTLELHDGNGNLLASNDDWQSDQAQEIIDSTVPPTDPRESAILRTLQPGNYTAIVRGKNETTGVALVEVFNLETP